MKFKNCAAWAKGWYKHRENISAWWMDLAHCINNDGCTIYTKKDVVQWCLHRFDSEPEFFKKSHGSFGFYDMYEHIKRDIDWARYHNEGHNEGELTIEDLIILYFRSCLSNKSKSDFEEGGFKPANWVLPFNLNEAWYDDGKWSSDHKPKFHFAEMLCDAEERVNQMFKDLDDQKPYYSFESWDADHNFDHIESDLRGKFWYDVVTDLGCEIGCDAYLISGEHLNRVSYNNCLEIDLSNILGNNEDSIYANLGRFAHSQGYDKNKAYRVYVKHSIRTFDWGDGNIDKDDEYTVMKIEEV